MKRKLLHIIFAIVAMLAFCRCSVDRLGRPGYDGSDAPELRFMFRNSAMSTKSTVITDEDNVDDANIFVYSGGELVNNAYCTYSGGPNVGDRKGWIMPLSRSQGGYDYHIYVLANVGRIDPPDHEAEMKALRITAENLNGFAPMYWTGNISSDIIRSRDVVVPLTRMVAKVNFRFDASGIDGMCVYSVRLCQAMKSMAPFSGTRNKAVSDADVYSPEDTQFDSAFRANQDADVFELDSARVASFYAFENMQGTLLPDNEDPWKKMPSGVGSVGSLDASKANLCTYIEIATRFQRGSQYYGQVIYRLFLGQDACTNFDIKRNQTINVTLKVTDESLTKENVSWKIDTLNLFRDKNVRDLTMYLAQRQTQMVIGEIRSISLDPDVPDVLENENLKIEYIGTDKESYRISSLGVGVDTVYVTLTDPSIDVPDEFDDEFVSKLCVTVLAPKLNFKWSNPTLAGADLRDSVYLAMDGEAKTLTPYYTDTSYNYEMQRGVEGKWGFNSKLYDQLLTTSVFVDSLESVYIDSKKSVRQISQTDESYDIWMKKLKSKGSAALDGHGFGFIGVASICPDVDTLKCYPYTENPFQQPGNYEFHSTSLIKSSANEDFYFPLGELKEYTGKSDAYYEYLHGTPTHRAVNSCHGSLFQGETMKITWYYAANGDLYIPSLSENFFGAVTNRYSNESWYSPLIYNAKYSVAVAIGAQGGYASGAKKPQNWFIQALWAHPHYNMFSELGHSPLAQFDDKIVATEHRHENDEYIKGVETPLYRLTWYEDVSSVPSGLGAAFYKSHEPDFRITDVKKYNSDGTVAPVIVEQTPYSLPLSGYDIRVYYYKEVGHPTNWIGVR